MDREAAVIRAQMSQTRADLDRKLTRLEERAHEMSPGEIVKRHMPEYALDQALGAALTVIGGVMAWKMYKANGRRQRVREAFASYGRW